MKDAFSVKSTLAGVFIQQGSLYLSFSVELIVYADRVMFKNKTKKKPNNLLGTARKSRSWFIEQQTAEWGSA